MKARSEALALEEDQFTIGEALEAAALRGGDKPVEQSDAAAIQAAEVRATRSDVVTPGGVAAIAESAASRNDRTPREEEKTRLSDVVEDATTKLPRDRAVRREDAAEIMDAELQNNPNLAMHRGGVVSGGVGSSMTAAARLNQTR